LTARSLRKGSIAATLFWLSGGWLVLALIATGFLLTSLYSQALDNTLSQTLEFYVESLTGSLLETDDPSGAEVRLPDPRFDRPRSGWYWQVQDASGSILNLSRSVVGIDVPDWPTSNRTQGIRTTVFSDAFGTQIRAVGRTVIIDGRTYDITVTGSLSEILTLVDQFRGQTFIVLGAVGVMLAVMSGIVARFAMRPIDQLSSAIERVREGDSIAIQGTYPREIAPLAEEVNELLRSNTQIIERARSQVGNLAHGLKTPIAVLRNEAAAHQGPLAEIVAGETEKMGAMVSTYLERARLAARTSVVGKKSDADMVLQRLVRVMRKIHPGVDLAIQPPEGPLPWFRGDEADLEEMAGNLIENACKWSKSKVGVQISAERDVGSIMLLIRIDDDGPGLSEDDAQRVLRRGVRLDEKTPGTGLGLDIVKELVDVYGGGLVFRRSQWGGLLVELRLPTARIGGMTKAEVVANAKS
jgi:signal transduction histidine kinase